MSTPRAMTGALSGIKILDLTSVIFGPYASQILADYGADVIKVEAPAGDSTRRTGPAYEEGMSAMFLGVNRNKRSIVLDLKQPEARDALLTLVDSADVFMHSIRPQKMAALGLSPEQLCQRNPRLIYAALLGFGMGGAYEGKPAYDDTIQGLSGIADIIARQTKVPGYFPVIAADKTSGLVAAHAILAALFERSRSGQGQSIEVPMFEVMTAFNLVEHFYGHHLPDQDQPIGYPRLMSPWRKPYQTKDGYLCLMPYTDSHWQRFFKLSGHEVYAQDPRFTSIKERTQNIDQLYALAQQIVSQKDSAFWLELCEKAEIPATRINALNELEHDPHLQDVEFFVDLQDTQNRTYRFARNPVRMQSGNCAIRLPPKLGEQTRAILEQAGLEKEHIDKLYESGAIY